MRIVFAIALLAAISCPRAEAADLRLPPPAFDAGRLREGELWRTDILPQGRLHPPRRVMGGPDYVGSVYGLGKPPVSGVGPRPDWGRSSAD